MRNAMKLLPSGTTWMWNLANVLHLNTRAAVETRTITSPKLSAQTLAFISVPFALLRVANKKEPKFQRATIRRNARKD
ncbi:hypothetical protein OESDEN_11980 [Oesophagostomum dentatum]|uniref:Uncharacterized protein n=1 Tax=Oesophagostomum dentatum TaxID=61180 RepID=A0A0B1STF6_OESDE|nr:hypothetical protein OESDEN_11980 [Oesophagostomum dentatum]